MNDSKIGTWLMRDGGTAVVLARLGDAGSHPFTLLGAYYLNGWVPETWTDEGRQSGSDKCRFDLDAKVSDSTELKPWKPEKKWRPWTIEEAAEAIRRGLYVTNDGDEFMQVFKWSIGASGVQIAGYGTVHVRTLHSHWRQHDGTPCGVEVEE